MKRWLRGSVVLATAVGVLSCSGDPTDSFRGGTSGITATPTSLFLQEGDTKAVIVQAIDDQGNPLAATFETSVGPGITVVEDTAFLPTNGAPIQGQTRYLVTATTFTGTSFTVTADGKSLEIPVRSLPVAFIGGFSNATPALGDTVTLTAPAGIRFGASTGITFPGAAGEPVITGISADSTVLSFLPAPGTDTVASVSGLELTYAAGVPIDTLQTTTKITTPSITEVPANFSTTSPAVNQAVTVTAPGFIFLPTAGVVFNGLDTATVVSVAADGSSMSFIAGPGVTGIPTIFGTALSFLPAVPLTLPATTSVTVSATVPTAGGTDDPTTAPSLATPDAGLSSVLYDKPDFTATVDHFYKLVVPEDGDYTITVDWTVGSDVDLIICNDAACSAPDFAAATGDKPESSTYSLTAGTYYVLAEDFGEDASGATVKVLVSRAAAE